MSTDGLFDKANYVCYDETGDSAVIRGVGYPQDQDTTGGVNYTILLTDQWNYDVFYTIKVYWVKDRAGNLIAENNYAFTVLPLVNSSITPPTVHITPEDFSIDTLQIDTVYASGQENADRGPEKAIDGVGYLGDQNALHCWTSCCITTPGSQWFVAGFDKDHFIQDVVLSGTYYYTGRVYGLQAQISQDGITWETIGNFNTIANTEWVTYNIGRRAKFLRINFLSNSTSSWAGLWELKVIGN
jgi:hypothetical protein